MTTRRDAFEAALIRMRGRWASVGREVPADQVRWLERRYGQERRPVSSNAGDTP